MKALVVGEAGSGKSSYAEHLACLLATKRTYIATMADSGAEAKERIARHRLARNGLGFQTIERTSTLSPFEANSSKDRGVVLLDDLGNLLANALFLEDTTMADPQETLERITNEVLMLSRIYDHTVVVGNEVGSATPSAWESTNVWIQLMGSLCCKLAADFDTVVEVVASVPCVVKGGVA